MFEKIQTHFVKSSQAIIRKGAVMSEKDARRNKILSIVSPLLVILILIIEITEPSQTLARKLIVWWLMGMLLLSSIVIPMTVYGYNNRHRINTEDEEPLDYTPGMAGALLGTALVPLGRVLFDYFGIN